MTRSVDEHISLLNDVLHREAIYSYSFKDRDELQGDEVNSLAQLVGALCSALSDQPSRSALKVRKHDVRTLEEKVHFVHGKTMNFLADANKEFDERFRGYQQELASVDDESIWDQARSDIAAYQRFAGSVLALAGISMKREGDLNAFERAAQAKDALDERALALTSQYGRTAFADRKQLDGVLQESRQILKEYEGIGRPLSMFPVPHRALKYQFENRVAPIREIEIEAQALKPQFDEVHTARKSLQKDITNYRRASKGWLPLPSEMPNVNAYENIGALRYTQDLVAEYRGICLEISELICERDIAEEQRALQQKYQVNSRQIHRVKKSSAQLPSTVESPSHRSTVSSERASYVSQVKKAPTQIAYRTTDSFDIIAYLHMRGSPPGDVSYQVSRVLQGKTEAKDWADRLEAVVDVISGAPQPDAHERRYLATLYDGLVACAERGVISQMMGRRVATRSIVREGLESLARYVGISPHAVVAA